MTECQEVADSLLRQDRQLNWMLPSMSWYQTKLYVRQVLGEEGETILDNVVEHLRQTLTPDASPPQATNPTVGSW